MNFLQKHATVFFNSLAVLFSAIVIIGFAWGVGYIVREIEKANSDQAATTQVVEFNIKGATALDYKGLTN